MKLARKSAFFVVILIAAFAMMSCRTRTKTPPPQTAPETVPEVAPPPTPVQSPSEDFVKEQPEVQTEELPADIAELNRTAQQKGWLQDAYFAFDASTLDANAQQALQASATWMKAHPEYQLLIEGHADERGTEQYNLALGDRRANTARDYLVTLGVDASRIKTISYGEERPFAMGHDDSAWAQNRRAHLVITGK